MPNCIDVPGGLTIAPSAFDFGGVQVNIEGTAQVFKVSNAGSTTGKPTVKIVGPNASDFVVKSDGCTAAIAKGGSCDVSVAFKPASGGGKAASLQVLTGTNKGVAASLTGTGGTGSMSIDPAAGNFGDVVTGRNATVTFNVRNGGTVPITGLTAAVAGPGYSIPMGGNKCTTLAGGASCQVDVLFAPTAAGQSRGTLTVTGAGGVTATAGLNGTAVGPAALVIQPDRFAFAAAVGAQSAAQTFIVANTGGVASRTLQAALTGANMGDFTIVRQGCVAALAGLATCEVQVAFKPGSAGAKVANLVVSETGAMPAMATAMLTGTATQGVLEASPAMVDFMTVTVGQQSALTTVTITNKGTGTTGALRAVSNDPNFTLSANNCDGADLAAMGTCTVSVRFAPTSAGAKSGLIQITSAGSGGSLGVMLKGVGVAAPVLSPNTATLTFGSQPINTTSGEQVVTFTNSGGNTSGALMVSLGGISPTQYSIGTNTCNAALAPTMSCMVSVRFTPTSTGDKSATLNVGDGTVSGTVALSGNGIIGAVLSVVATGTSAVIYDYSCASGICSPPAQEASGTVVGTMTGAQGFTITNTGMTSTGALSVTLTNANAGDYMITSAPCPALGPSESCQVSVIFKPTAIGTRVANLTAAGSGSTGSAQLTGTGLGVLEFRPRPLTQSPDFGQVSVGVTSNNKQYDVVQRAVISGVISISLVDPQTPGSFTVDDAFDFTLAAGSTTAGTCPGLTSPTKTSVACRINVYFAPKDPRGAKTATITASATGVASATATVTGTAVGPMTIVADGPFAAADIGGRSPDVTFTVSNAAGGSPIGPLSKTVTGDTTEFVIAQDNCTGTTIGFGTCTIVAAFQPTSAGNKTLTIAVTGVVATTSTSETATITVTATGGTGTPFTATPGSIAFGDAPPAGSSAVQTLTLTAGGIASGAVDLRVVDPFFVFGVGPEAGTCGLTAVDNAFGGGDNNATAASMAASATCTVKLYYRPTVASALGPQSATLNVTPASTATAIPIAVSANVIDPLTITPVTASAGNAVAGQAGASTATYTVENKSDATVTFATSFTNVPPTGQTLDNYVAGVFQTEPPATGVDCTSGTIMAKSSCVIVVRLVPPGATPKGLVDAGLLATGTINATAFDLRAKVSGTVVQQATLTLRDITVNETRDFGGVRSGNSATASHTITLKNTGGVATSAITVTTTYGGGAATTELPISGCGFSATSMTQGTIAALGAGATCDLTVGFTASGTAGARSLVLSFTATPGGTPPTVTFEGQVLNVSTDIYSTPTLLNFGEQNPSAAATATQMVTLTNPTGTLTALASTVPTNYTISQSAASNACTVTAGALAGTITTSCVFLVAFNPPAAAGYYNQEITINGGTSQVGLIARVRNPGQITFTNPTEGLSFGQVVLPGPSAVRTFTLTNTGEVATGPMTVVATDAANFTVSANTCPTTGTGLAKDATCTVGLAFAPSALGAQATSLTATYTGAASPTSVTGITGTGVVAARLVPSPVSNNFATTTIVGASVSQTFTISNVNNGQTTAPLVFSLTGGDTTQFRIGTGSCGATGQRNGLTGSGATQFCTVDVFFEPTAVATSFSTTFRVTAGSVSVDIPLTGGSVVGLTSTSPVNVGSIAVGMTTGGTTLTINNTSAGSTGPLKVSLTGSPDFVITNNQCQGISVTGGNSCNIEVKLSAMAPAGAKSATLVVTGTQTGNTVSVSLTGTAN